MSKKKWILVWLLASLACVCAEASLLESKNPKRFNALTQGTAYGSTNPQPDTQFSGVNATSSGVIEPAVTAQLRLTKGRMGYTFAGTVPRYYLGEEILPPETLHSASTETLADGFWRAKPVRPGEIFSNPDGTPLIDTDGSPLPNLTPGDSAGAPLPALANGEYESFYYSKHADAVFASRPGTVEIWWVSASPQGSNGGAWQFRRESFTVSGAASAPVRKIYWTEKSFDGPRVSIPTGRIERVNPVYTANFPIQVSKEYQPPGFVQNPDPNAQMPSEKRTLWFENQAGNAQLAAYNLEGRLLVEYLGPEISPGRHEFLGADVVEVVRSASTVTLDVDLGKQILPRNQSLSLIGSPILNLGTSANYYNLRTRSDGTSVFYAERENLNPDQVIFYWLSAEDAGIDLLTGNQTPGLRILWPKYKDRYRFLWPVNLVDYAYNTTDPEGSDAENGIQFSLSTLPTVVWQDDKAQSEASFDSSSQRFIVALNADKANRALLRFTSQSSIWYQLVYTQSEDRSGYLEPDQGTALSASALVGNRIERPSSQYEIAGAITGGRCYMETAYRNPYSIGVESASTGAIIPVNANPADNVITVRWFEKVTPPDNSFEAFYVPSKVGRYTVAYPASSAGEDRVVMASNLGTTNLTSAQANGSLYVQNDRDAIGFNPNEEHALKKDAKYWALRDDLNVTSGNGYTSEPFILIAYTDPADNRPAMRTFRVLREDETHTFQYPWTAGTLLQGPMPLPLMNLPLRGGNIANTEVAGLLADPAAAVDAPASYDSFTFEDRKGYKWVYRGPHTGGSPGFGMQWYYPMTAGFHTPGLTTQPAEGTALPFLRPLDSEDAPLGDPVSGTALTVHYTPAWPGNVPILRIGETLTLAKYGLPDVRNQKSAAILYQQSVAAQGTAKGSVTLYDPTRFKLSPLKGSGLESKQGALDGKIPEVIRTSNYQGKTYFQGLPPHLQTRFYFNPLVGTKGSLVLEGVFNEAIAGEDYLELNTLSAQDILKLKNLAVNASATQQSNWATVIDALATKVETFEEDPARKGIFIVSKQQNPAVDYGLSALPQMPDSDTARDSYALNATGQGEGYVTLAFANGKNPDFTPAGDPISLKIIKVVPELYNGELKVRLSSNPLDEQVTLRHSSDFAARPDNYVFEWRWAPPASNGTQPPTYTLNNEILLGNSADSASRQWHLLQSPVSALPVATSYPPTATSLPASLAVNSSGYDAQAGLPGLVARSREPVDFSGGVPAELVFSADLASHSGFVLYVNGTIAEVYRNDIPALASFVSGSDYDVRLLKLDTAADLPTTGNRLIVVADVADELHFQIYDPAGQRVITLAESELPGKTTEIADLESRLSSLWATTNLLNSDKQMIAGKVSAIVSHDLTRKVSTGLSPNGLSLQFQLDGRYFVKGPNTIEVALYSSSDAEASSTLDFRLEGSTRTDAVLAQGTPWTQATGLPALDNRAIVGGSPTAPLGSPLLVMSDNYFTMRYRAKEYLPDGVTPNPAYSLTNGAWSQWTRPALVEGWVKRVLAAINPFNQRVKDLFNNAVNTDVSLLTQAGTRWEGDIALTLDAINDFGLIEIYETVLNRAKAISIESGYNYGPANDALLLTAGYLSDLYSILGNEAYADAANSTISIDDADSSLEINTSRFSFEGQVASVLEEELALLRGRDDFLSPQVTQSPFYNRLFWNYTRGIDSGEVLYATNYNIMEKVGSSTEDGLIDAADAQRMFPQGHGDARGHYLTALKGYYKLLLNPNFTWIPRTESLNILGNTVAVDYQDERKIAEAAANIARTDEQVIALTWRQQYKDDPSAGWSHFRDGKQNPETGTTRNWGLDAWISRASQGAYYHWAVGNALVPDVDNVNSGIQKIDRSTVLELQLLPVSAASFQATADSASAGLNPLGLSPGAVAFDIDPTRLKTGKSHFEQVYDRALASVRNAKGAFDQAASMTRLLRKQENTIDDFNTTLKEQERAFNYQLIDLFGEPYSGDMGPGRTYVQDYDGPDLYNWFVVDRPQAMPDFVENEQSNLVELNDHSFVGINQNDSSKLDIETFLNPDQNLTDEYSIYVRQDAYTQFSDEYWGPEREAGKRGKTGVIQDAIRDAISSWLSLDETISNFQKSKALLNNLKTLITAQIDAGERSIKSITDTNRTVNQLQGSILAMDIGMNGLETAIEIVDNSGDTIIEAFPKVAGMSNDPSPTARATIKNTTATTVTILRSMQNVLNKAASSMKLKIDLLTSELRETTATYELEARKQQLYYEYIKDWRDVNNYQFEIASLAETHQRNLQKIIDLKADGDRILLEREIFRKRAATMVQGYRTTDLAFRAFRNEALEQYRTLFDLAARYSYLAAKSYDYETGLLGTPEGRAEVERVISSRALGDLTGGTPQATVSSLGDSGLAGTLARLQADFSVAEGRLGIKNPDNNGTLFSLRQELFRLLKDPNSTEDDTAWRQTLEQHMVSDLMADPDVAKQCMNIRKPDGSAVPGIIIPFSSTIEHGKNFFGLPLAGGDHKFSASNFATKIYSTGVLFENYVGMDPYSEQTPGSTGPDLTNPQVLSATPYVYLIPVGLDKMRAPPLGDTGTIRTWQVRDQALPMPYNLGANDFSDTQFFDADGSLSEKPWILRKHPAFRPVDDPAYFYGLQPAEFTNTRLVGRSVWNTQWKLVIPAYELLANEQEGLNRFAATVSDIKLFLRTYSNAGN